MLIAHLHQNDDGQDGQTAERADGDAGGTRRWILGRAAHRGGSLFCFTKVLEIQQE